MSEVNLNEKYFLSIINALNNEEALIAATNKCIQNELNKNFEEIEKLNEVFLKLTTEYNDVKLTCNTMQKTLNEKENELKKLDKYLNTLESENNELEQEYDKIENNLVKIKDAQVLSDADKKLFELSRKKLDLYIQMTNIKWDYSVPLSSPITRGYIRNKNYLNAFEFKKDEKWKDKLWKEIEQGSGEDWSDIVAMTNVTK